MIIIIIIANDISDFVRERNYKVREEGRKRGEQGYKLQRIE